MHSLTRLIALALTVIVVLGGVTTGAGARSPQLSSDAPTDTGPVIPPDENGTMKFEVTTFTAPANATTTHPVTVNATINNTGNGSGLQVVEYRFNGSVVDTRPVTLAPNESRTVSFTLNTLEVEAGEYTHGVYTANDSATAEINITTGDDTGPVGNLSGDVASFQETSPLTPFQTNPNNLSGKLRVESPYAANTSVNLTRSSSTEYTLAINVTGNATNVTFYLQQQAVSSSQNISNLSAYLDGQEFNFTVKQTHGKWIVFVVDHFSTRTVTFADLEKAPAQNVDDDLPLEDVNSDQTFDVLDVVALYDNMSNPDITENPTLFNFNGDPAGSIDILDVVALYNQLSG